MVVVFCRLNAALLVVAFELVQRTIGLPLGCYWA
jgi:hypothetical protein